MARACVTLDGFIELFPEFASFGAASKASLAVTGDPAPGSSVTVTLDRQDLPEAFSLTAGTDFAVAAGDTAQTAANIAAAFNLQGTLEASSIPSSVYIKTKAPGWASQYALASDSPEMVWSDTRMARGDDQIEQVLACTCCMINLDQWGDKASCGHAYLAAHFLTVEAGGEAGILSNRKIDTIQEGYTVPTYAQGDAGFALTRFGRLYLQLRATLLTPPFIGRKHLAFQGWL